MDEPEAPPPHAGKPLTREDVLRLIEEHGGPEGLDLSYADLREADLQRVDLSGVSLQGANLRRAKLQGAYLLGANLQEAQLLAANLQAGYLVGANLQGAYLSDANLQEANLRRAKLQGTSLRRADLRWAEVAYATLRDTNLEDVNWGDYVLGEEIAGDFDRAASAYRALKQRHTEAGMYDIAGEFHYREMEARRRQAWNEHRLPYALGLNALGLLYGYGEWPERVIGWVVAVILGFALGHWLFGTVSGGFLDALYYSAVSFPALGYGSWAPQPQGWAGRFLGVGESLLGVFMMALFLVTFTRKMTR
jgi:hypothetical protein